MLMRTVEPVAQVRRRLIGRLTIKGHHRRRHARNPDEMCAPAVFTDPRHFNDKGPAGNGSFEAVPHDSYLCSE